jgi:hypothetical protein
LIYNNINIDVYKFISVNETQNETPNTTQLITLSNITPENMIYIGKTASWTRELKFLNYPKFLSGDVLQTIVVDKYVNNTLYVRNYVIQKKVKINDFETIKSLIFNTSVFLINVDNKTPEISLDKFKSMWFNSCNCSNPKCDCTNTMQSYVDKCSWGKASLSPDKGYNQIVDLLKYPMPAYGRTAYSNITYNTTLQCGFIEMYAYQEWAQKKYEDIHGKGSLDKYRQRIVVMPFNNCPWYGTGSQGCLGKYCYIWVRGDRVNFLNTYFHELGHNINLQHSGTSSWEYGDCSCAMGCSSDRGCFNGPTSIRAGWAVLIANYTNVQVGKWYSHVIPPLEKNMKNTVRFDLNWTNVTNARYYLSMRAKVGYDAKLDDKFFGKISVHYSQANNIYDFFKTNLITTIAPGSKYNDTVNGIIISFIRMTRQRNAQVSFCRFSKTYITKNDCKNNFDSDCNGIIDGKESICKITLESIIRKIKNYNIFRI